MESRKSRQYDDSGLRPIEDLARRAIASHSENGWRFAYGVVAVVVVVVAVVVV